MDSYRKKTIKEKSFCKTKIKIFIILLIFLLFLLCAITITFLFPINESNTIKQRNLIWYQNEIIYEINVPMFRDSNQDGIGDFQGLMEKIDYFENTNINTVLLQSSIFNHSDDLYEIIDRQYAEIQTTNLLKFDPKIGEKDDFQNLLNVLKNKKMHLIIDLPLSSTSDHRDLSWYGSSTFPSISIRNPCALEKNNLGCNYYKFYKRIPLDFSNEKISKTAESRLSYWLDEMNVDGIRVDLPLRLSNSTNIYSISKNTINRWKSLTKLIENKTNNSKLLLFDIPFNFNEIISNKSFGQQILYSTSLLNFIEKQQLTKKQNIKQNEDTLFETFWQLGSNRESFHLGMMHDLSQRISFTIGMLIGGTPMILYGSELGIKQRNKAWMPWTSDPHYNGFSSCVSYKCNETLLSYEMDFSETNVESQEIMGDINNESLLVFIRRLSKLRKHPSFQYGVLKKGFDSTTGIFWFIRQAPGHRGFIVLIHNNRFKIEPIYVSLKNLTNQTISDDIHVGYQSVKLDFDDWQSTVIDSSKILIYPGSINIFWWSP